MRLVRLLAFTSLVGFMPLAAQAADRLIFDPGQFSLVHVTLDGQPIEVRRYHVVYVAKPIAIDTNRHSGLGGPPVGLPPAAPTNSTPTSNATAPANGQGPMATSSDPLAWQSMYVYVPAASVTNAKTAIILQVNNGGWMASPARDILREGAALSSTSDSDNTGAALKAGYIVVSAGTRGRGIVDMQGGFAGKAPAAVVDAKAAIRYLRKNDGVMPGSAERIVITGTSGGGGLSVAVAASGNSPDYLPELTAIGAAGIDMRGRSTLSDDVFATIAYCPINDLGHADAAYEWQYGALRSASNSPASALDAAHRAGSSALAKAYPDYLNGLDLKDHKGVPLSAATMPSAIIAMVKDSAEQALGRNIKIPALGEDFEIKRQGPPGAAATGVNRLKNDWITVENGKVAAIDYDRFLAFVAANQTLKGVPAFDSSGNTGNRGVTGENTLFGSSKVQYANFTAYGWDQNDTVADGSGPDDIGQDWVAHTAGEGASLARQIRLVSPLPYLTARDTKVAPYWYVRHGTLDRDTAFAVQVTLSAAIKSHPMVQQANVKLAWMRGHAGNYDVQEAYSWLAGALGQARAPMRAK